jgi:hypothetical protein
MCQQYETHCTEHKVDSAVNIQSKDKGWLFRMKSLIQGSKRQYWRRSHYPQFVWTLALCASAVPFLAYGKDHVSYGEGLIVNIPLPENEVEQVVADVAQNGIIRGTKEYNKDEYVSGAQAATSSRSFPEWDQGGQVFYKVRLQALDPRNFKDSGDSGTLTVRYVVKAQGEKNTVLRIDAVFQEDFRHSIHPSNGSVESAEYKDIQEHIEAIQVMKKQNLESERERQERLAKKHETGMWGETQTQGESSSRTTPEIADSSAAPVLEPKATPPAPPQTRSQKLESPQPGPAQPADVSLQAGQTLQQHVEELRKQVGRVVKAPGAPLKSAPFHTASTLQSLASGTEVLILINTAYWYGVETHDGQHGWLMRDQLEQR